MMETFYGPWRLITQSADFGPTWAFRVHNSDDADGVYEADSPQPWTLNVHGAEWVVELIYLDGSGQWQPAPDVVQTTGIVAPNGLTVTLNSHTPIRLECVSLDSTINPPMHSNPYDFTTPGG